MMKEVNTQLKTPIHCHNQRRMQIVSFPNGIRACFLNRKSLKNTGYEVLGFTNDQALTKSHYTTIVMQNPSLLRCLSIRLCDIMIWVIACYKPNPEPKWCQKSWILRRYRKLLLVLIWYVMDLEPHQISDPYLYKQKNFFCQKNFFLQDGLEIAL